MADDTRALALGAIRALTEAATPGPWQVGDGGDYFEWEVVIAPHLPTLELSESADGAADAEFIAAARTAIPALLDEIDRLNRIVAAMAKDAAEQAEHMGELLDREGPA